MTTADPRLTPARPDLAAAYLRGHVAAERFVEGRRLQVIADVLDLKRHPRHDSALDTQLLYGETVQSYEDDGNGWAWVQAERDGYVGYVASHGLSETVREPTHRVTVTRTFVYPAPDMKLPVVAALPLGALVAVHDVGAGYARLQTGGHVFLAHLATLDHPAESDPVAVAEWLLGTPYLWGGRTPQGIDCSGLVQMSFGMTGTALPRDTHRQEEAGRPVPVGEDLAGLVRGDLVFWRGHVGVMRDAEIMIHANAHHMMVRSEPLREASLRIAATGDRARIISIRRHLAN